MARYQADRNPLTPTPAGGTARSRGKAGPALKGKTASKRKPLKTHPGHTHDATGQPFKVEAWHEVPKETSGKAPKRVQTTHPAKSPRKKGKPTLH